MVKFCTNCSNSLKRIYINDNLYFKCILCNIVYNHSPDDTLIYENITGGDISIFEDYLRSAIKDPTVMLINTKCINSKCDGKLAKRARIETGDVKVFNVCASCGVQWLN
jgi:DNA-directed RNA polymerase subunit M/transcription elongation factor TFIIS